jgi:tRNA-2-methylthio-N6-dimethylallyladenosine synthase
VQSRFERLLARQTEISEERNRELIGETVEITIERGSSKRNAAKASGRTRTNKLVHLASDAPVGASVDATIAAAGAHYLSA